MCWEETTKQTAKDNKSKNCKKLHEVIERKMKFGQKRVANTSVDSQVVDWREVQRLSYPPLTAADSMIHQLIYIHATMCEPAPSSLPSCEVQVFILPPHLSLFISLFIPRLKISLVFWSLFSVCSKFCQSYVLCIRMNFASRLLLSQLLMISLKLRAKS